MPAEVVGRRQADRIPSVIVVDPCFDAYAVLATAAREGRITLHLRSSGAAALKLARRLPVDAWLVAENLDDMSGHDCVKLLGEIESDWATGKVAIVGAGPVAGGPVARVADREARAVGVDAVFEQPISLADLARLLTVPAEERAATLSLADLQRGFVTLPVGIGAAVVAMAVLMLG